MPPKMTTARVPKSNTRFCFSSKQHTPAGEAHFIPQTERLQPPRWASDLSEDQRLAEAVKASAGSNQHCLRNAASESDPELHCCKPARVVAAIPPSTASNTTTTPATPLAVDSCGACCLKMDSTYVSRAFCVDLPLGCTHTIFTFLPRSGAQSPGKVEVSSLV